jgi:hypothetical protein
MCAVIYCVFWAPDFRKCILVDEGVRNVGFNSSERGWEVINLSQKNLKIKNLTEILMKL